MPACSTAFIPSRGVRLSMTFILKNGLCRLPCRAILIFTDISCSYQTFIINSRRTVTAGRGTRLPARQGIIAQFFPLTTGISLPFCRITSLEWLLCPLRKGIAAAPNKGYYTAATQPDTNWLWAFTGGMVAKECEPRLIR